MQYASSKKNFWIAIVAFLVGASVAFFIPREHPIQINGTYQEVTPEGYPKSPNRWLVIDKGEYFLGDQETLWHSGVAEAIDEQYYHLNTEAEPIVLIRAGEGAYLVGEGQVNFLVYRGPRITFPGVWNVKRGETTN
ncbi:MAG: hypothetical protein SOR89_05160 [Ndongobacter sp.]|nr:hypothetical protein [Ndongobacter sp.]